MDQLLQYREQLALAQTPRQFLNILRKAFPKKMASESYLRLETQLANSPLLQFNIGSDVVDTTTRNSTEVRLNRNDLFVATRWGFFLKKVVSGAHSKAKLYTYPQPSVFADDSTTFLNADLEGVYNGRIGVKIDSTVQIEAYDMQRFRQAPSGLQIGDYTTGFVTHAGGANVERQISDEGQNPDMGIVDLNGFLIFDGTRQHEINLTIPDGSSLKIAHTASNTANWAVLKLEGFLIKAAK